MRYDFKLAEVEVMCSKYLLQVQYNIQYQHVLVLENIIHEMTFKGSSGSFFGSRQRQDQAVSVFIVRAFIKHARSLSRLLRLKTLVKIKPMILTAQSYQGIKTCYVVLASDVHGDPLNNTQDNLKTRLGQSSLPK